MKELQDFIQLYLQNLRGTEEIDFYNLFVDEILKIIVLETNKYLYIEQKLKIFFFKKIWDSLLANQLHKQRTDESIFWYMYVDGFEQKNPIRNYFSTNPL